MNNNFDVIVVGGGHAGIEATWAAAKMGAKTLLLTLDENKIATMSCNPSIGGLGKGHIVYEISALGGLMPKLCTKTYLQARMLNTSKGPAVQGLRLQIDKFAYSKLALECLKNTSGVTIYNKMGCEIITQRSQECENHTGGDSTSCDLHTGCDNFSGCENKKCIKSVCGVKTFDGEIFYAPSVIITTGTFLNGVIHIGRVRYKAGRRGEASVPGLSESISKETGVPIGRLKTGTPPRLLKSSVNFSVLERQKNTRLDYLFEFDSVPVQEKIPCYIALTNNNTHEIIKKNLRLSALYSGNIKGIGPRYCPSIEDKVGRFAHQESHHIFVEPEGEFSDDVYPAGISTSLPLSVQNEYIRSIKGFENAQITKCGYAIEYDFFQPINLKHTLESKKVKGLFLAGQINGTTGYEEAAGQGLIAGINAILCLNKKDPFVLNRTESYIGVMIDDLVTLGADEPYRMFTSRAERRLLLRQDNVFYRLGDYGKKFGLVSDELYKKYCEERDLVNYCVDKARAQENSELYDLLHSVEFTPDVQEKCKVLLGVPQISSRVLLSVYANIRYAGYLEKERKEIEKTEKFQALEIPDTLDYKNMSGLTVELQQKLLYYKPKTIAQAQLIPGMTPAAVSILIFQVRMREKGNNTGL